MKLIFYLLLYLYTSLPIKTAAQASLAFSIKTIENRTIDIAKTIKTRKATVFIFLMPDCPLCEYYTLSLKKLQADYQPKNVDFYLVFAGTLFSKDEIKTYLTKYDLRFTAILDEEKKLANLLNAEVTPQAIVINSSFKRSYTGKIDNWITENRQHRTRVTEFYLADALQAALHDKPVPIAATQAIGCFIQ